MVDVPILPPASDMVIVYGVAVGVFVGYILGALVERLRAGEERRKRESDEATPTRHCLRLVQ